MTSTPELCVLFCLTPVLVINISTFTNHARIKAMSTFFMDRMPNKNISTFSNHVRTKPYVNSRTSHKHIYIFKSRSNQTCVYIFLELSWHLKTYLPFRITFEPNMCLPFWWSLVPAINISTFSNHVWTKPVSNFLLDACDGQKYWRITFKPNLYLPLSWTLVTAKNISTISNPVRTKPVSIFLLELRCSYKHIYLFESRSNQTYVYFSV